MAVLALGALVAGCSTTPSRAAADPAQQRAIVAARPNLDDEIARYEQMQQRIQAQLDAALGNQKWETLNPGSQSTCGFDFADVHDAQTRVLPLLGVRHNIPDQQWPEAEHLVTTIIAGYGFNTAGLLRIDQPGRHEINAHDPDLGADFTFGTEKFTTLQTTTGCHLPAIGQTGVSSAPP